MKKVEHFFKTHPDATDVHQTTDGLLFFLKDNAIAHTQVMARENKNFSTAVKTFTRDQVEAPAKVQTTAKASEVVNTDPDKEKGSTETPQGSGLTEPGKEESKKEEPKAKAKTPVKKEKSTPKSK